MPKLNIEHKHSLPPEEVKTRMDALNLQLATKYGIESRWTSPTEATFKRTGATGTLTCHADKVVVVLDLSFALTPMKGQVESRIRHELNKALG